MSTYTQDITHLINKIDTNIPDNDTQYITAARIRDAMGAVAYNYDLYVLKTDLDTAGYVTASALSGYATQDDLQTGMQSVLDDSYAYVVEKINEIPGVDLSAYVTKDELSAAGYLTAVPSEYITDTELSGMGYITSSDLPDMSAYVSQDDLQSALEPYVTESQLTSMSYATKTYVATEVQQSQSYMTDYVADYVATHTGPVDLSAYVTKTELSEAGYLTAVPSEYVTDTELSSMGYITEAALGDYVTETELSQAGYLTSIPSEYVTDTELNSMGYITDTELSNVLSTASYVTQNELSNAGYITNSDLSQASYVTQQALSGMGYITTIPSEYITETELSEMGYITSSYAETYYLDYTSFGDYTSAMQDTLINANILITDPETGDWTTQTMASETYVADYVASYAPTPDLSTYVTKDELSAAGYLTSVPSEYITETELSGMGYITSSYASTYYLDIASFGDYTSAMQDTLVNANILITDPETGDWTPQLMASETYVAEYVASYAPTPDLSTYVTKDELSAAGYLTTVPSEYITETELSSMGYITSSDIPAIPVIDESIIPNTTNTYTLGDSTHRYNATYSHIYNFGYNTRLYSSNDYNVVLWVYNNRYQFDSQALVHFDNSTTSSLGTSSKQWGYTYSAYFIENGTNISEIYATKTQLNAKQDTLVSGTNIKTINNESILGSGNIDIQGGGPTDYSHVLTFTAAQNNSTINLQRHGNDTSMTNAVLEYSTDGGETWNDYTLGTTITLATVGSSVMFKGINETLGITSSNYHQFSMSGKIKASGDVTSLLNGEGGDWALKTYCFGYLFYGCSALTQAPELPSTKLGMNCYFSMFQACTSLTEAPELPAKTLMSSCYQSMFYGCTALTKAPVLPATTMEVSCYNSMFYGCTSLRQAPELPATTLARYCYATMFQNCTSLINAPVLPATNLIQYCYQGMFNGCSNLNYVKAMFTYTPSNTYTADWLKGVSTHGTFVKSNNATWTNTGTNAVPILWTVYKTVALDTDDVPESYVEDNGKGLQVVNGAWQKVSGLLTSANLIYDSTTNTLTINV